MTTYDEVWVQRAFRGAPGAGPEVTRQVAEATGVRDLASHLRTLNAWAATNSGAEGNPDYWKRYKSFAIASMQKPQADA